MGRTGVLTAIERRSIQQAQGRAKELMKPALLQLLEGIEQRYEDQVKQSLRFYRWLGERVDKVKENPSRYSGVNGEDGLELVRQAVGTKAQTLRRAHYFFSRYSEKEFEELLDRSNSNDTRFRLHWGHVTLLLSVENKNLRASFEKKAVEQLWTPVDLHDMIKKHYGGPRAKGGQPLRRPTSLDGMLRQMRTMSELWARRHDEVWLSPDNNVFDDVANTPSEEYTPEMLAELQAIQRVMNQIASGAGQDTERCQEIITQVEAAVAENQSASRRRASTTAAAGAASTARRGRGRPASTT